MQTLEILTTLIAGTKDDLIELIIKVERASKEARLYLNDKKIKVMTTGEVDYIIVDDNNIEIINKFIYLRVPITKYGVADNEL